LPPALESERVHRPEFGPAFELGRLAELEPESGLALEPAPMTSHTARLRRPKLPGISSRFLLEMQMPASSCLFSSSDAGQWRLATGFPNAVL
jgi:hypothetical protein